MNSIEVCAFLGRSLSPLFECSPAPMEGVRVRTPMMFPDGGIVDVFVLERSDGFTVTDFGDALGWLHMQSVSRGRTRRQELLIEDVCQTLNVQLFRGQLILRNVNSEELGEAVIRLGQAVVRVSDIWFTMRSQTFQTTADEVEEWLNERQIPFERGVRERGRSNQDWTIDFRTETSHTSFVFLLGTGARGATRRITEHVLAGCVDLSHLRSSQPNLAFVSLFDDTQDVWREQDFRLVADHSEIAYWSHPDTLEQLLIA